MARPTKSGIDYFPLDVETEDKIKLIEAKYGMTGFAVWIKLLQKIYKHGYYIDWTEEKILLFSNEVNVDINKVNEIINDCLKWEVFDETLKEKYGILTSRGIQKRYFEATGRRKEVEVNENYLLVNGGCKKLNWVYVNKNKVNDNNNSINESKSTQSRVEDKRVKENKNSSSEESDTESDKFSLTKKDNGRYDYPEDYERLYSLYPYQRGNKKAGWRKWAATRRKKVDQKDLVEAVKNYAAKCKKDGTEEKWVMHIKKFFGPDEYWKEYLGGNDNGKNKMAGKNRETSEGNIGEEVEAMFNS